jgi:hypothetical protein
MEARQIIAGLSCMPQQMLGAPSIAPSSFSQTHTIDRETMINQISHKMKIDILTLSSSAVVILTLSLSTAKGKGKNPRILHAGTK